MPPILIHLRAAMTDTCTEWLLFLIVQQFNNFKRKKKRMVLHFHHGPRGSLSVSLCSHIFGKVKPESSVLFCFVSSTVMWEHLRSSRVYVSHEKVKALCSLCFMLSERTKAHSIRSWWASFGFGATTTENLWSLTAVKSSLGCEHCLNY